MKNNSFAEMTTEQLLKRRSIVKLSLIMCLIAAGVMLAAGIYLSIVKHKLNALAVLPITMGILVMVNASNLKMIKAELNERGI